MGGAEEKKGADNKRGGGGGQTRNPRPPRKKKKGVWEGGRSPNARRRASRALRLDGKRGGEGEVRGVLEICGPLKSTAAGGRRSGKVGPELHFAIARFSYPDAGGECSSGVQSRARRGCGGTLQNRRLLPSRPEPPYLPSSPNPNWQPLPGMPHVYAPLLTLRVGGSNARSKCPHQIRRGSMRSS